MITIIIYYKKNLRIGNVDDDILLCNFCNRRPKSLLRKITSCLLENEAEKNDR